MVDGFLCSAMFRVSGEAGKEAEHAEAEAKKLEELHRRIEEAQATPYHALLLQVCPLLMTSGSSNIGIIYALLLSPVYNRRYTACIFMSLNQIFFLGIIRLCESIGEYLLEVVLVIVAYMLRAFTSNLFWLSGWFSLLSVC